MPELPEVETIRRQLAEKLIGQQIVGIEVRQPKVTVGDLQSIRNDKIVKLGRVGKYLFVHMKSGIGLAVHLKMTGRWVIGTSADQLVSKSANQQASESIFDYETAPHTRVVMTLSNGAKLYYWDTRMFGYLRVEPQIADTEEKLKKKLGPEPWEISEVDLLRKLQKTRRSIKEVILDQNVLAGVGNIYANDGLWKAGIDPRRKANSLKLSEGKKLLVALREVLARGLATGGASDNSYVNALGTKGSYQDEFLVYKRTGEPCHRCGTALKRIVVGGRGTWICEQCQR